MTDEMEKFISAMRLDISLSDSSGPFGGDGTILIDTKTLSNMVDYIESVEILKDKLREKQNDRHT